MWPLLPREVVSHNVLGFIRSAELRHLAVALPPFKEFIWRSLCLRASIELDGAHSSTELRSKYFALKSRPCDWCQSTTVCAQEAGERVVFCATCRLRVRFATDEEKQWMAEQGRTNETVLGDNHLKIGRGMTNWLIAKLRINRVGHELVVEPGFSSLKTPAMCVDRDLQLLERQVGLPHRLGERFGRCFQSSFVSHFVEPVAEAGDTLTPIKQTTGVEAPSPTTKQRKRKRLMPVQIRRGEEWTNQMLARVARQKCDSLLVDWQTSKTFLGTWACSQEIEEQMESISNVVRHPHASYVVGALVDLLAANWLNELRKSDSVLLWDTIVACLDRTAPPFVLGAINQWLSDRVTKVKDSDLDLITFKNIAQTFPVWLLPVAELKKLEDPDKESSELPPNHAYNKFTKIETLSQRGTRARLDIQDKLGELQTLIAMGEI